ncbi:MAG: STING domain-containing protein [Bacteroidota bacterium]
MNTKFAFRWLTLKSLGKFFDAKAIVTFILPTAGFYYDIIPKVFNVSSTLLIFIVAVVFLLLFLFNLYQRYTDHERSIAEVLETGYFTNFFEKTAMFIKNKKDNNETILVNFKDGSFQRVQADQLRVQVILPTSLAELRAIMKLIDKTAKPGTLDNGPWILATPHDNHTITIHECPRTLQALSRYLGRGEHEYTEVESKRLHRLFNEKFIKDWENEGDKIPSDIFFHQHKLEAVKEVSQESPV